jgi:predicted 3-demethylubiquinone-9 3-methyltransferase (glyoxalase superfamily)
MTNQIVPCLWFEKEAEEAAKFYTSIFKNSSIEKINYYSKEGFEIHHQKDGTVMTVSFKINGQLYTALNGGPLFKFNEAISFQVYCETQDEIDLYWNKLTEGGHEGQCGWLKDKYGISWQIMPSILPDLIGDANKAERVTNALLKMNKLNIKQLLLA